MKNLKNVLRHPLRAGILILLLVVVVAASRTSLAAVIATDDFDSYTAASDLDGANSGTGWAGAWSVGGIADTNTNATATVDDNDLPSGTTADGNSVSIANNDRQAVVREMAAAQTGTFYASVYIQPNLDGADTNAFFTVWFYDSNGAIAIDDIDGGTDRPEFGFKDSDTFVIRTVGFGADESDAGSMTNNTTYQLIAQISKSDPGGADVYDTVDIYLDPSTNTLCSGVPTPFLTNSGAATDNPASIDYFGISTNGLDAASSVLLDEIRIGDDWFDVLGEFVAPTYSLNFVDEQVNVGGTTTVEYTIDNSASSLPICGFSLGDTFPGFTITADEADPACNVFSVTGQTTDTFTFVGTGIDAGATCTITFTVDESDGTRGVRTLEANTLTYNDDGTEVTADTVDSGTDTIFVGGEQLSFSMDTYNFNESDGTVSITVERDGAGTGEVSVDVITLFDPGTADQGTDYTGVDFVTGETVTLGDGVFSETVDIDLVDDNFSEATETILLNLDSPVGADLGATDTATVNIADNDPAGVTLSGTTGLEVNEEGTTTDTYSIALDTEPEGSDQVSIDLTTNGECTVSPNPVVLDSGNYTGVTVTVTAVDDGDDETSPHTCTIQHDINDGNTDATNYSSAINIPDVTVDVLDNDERTVGITVDPTTVSVTEGGTTTFTIQLDDTPTNAVTIPLSAAPLAQCDISLNGTDFFSSTDLVVSDATAQTVTVRAFDDTTDEGPHTCTVTTGDPTSSDTAYDDLGAGDVDDVTVNITDNDGDTAGFTVTESGGSTDVTEGGDTDSITVVLTAAPASGETVTISLSDSGSEVDLNPTSLEFTDANWDTPQAVTISAIDDADAEGDHTTTVVLSAASSVGGSDYNSLADQEVTVNITDNDLTGTANLLVNPTTLNLDEGANGTFTIAASPAPSATVSLQLTADAQCTVSPTTVTILSGSTAPVEVTVTAIDDAVAEGTHTCTITTGDPSSTDADYDDLTAADVADVTVNITDDDGGDAPAVTFDPTAVDFGNVNFGVTAGPQTVTLENTGGAVLNIESLTLTGDDFAASGGTCPTTFPAALAVGASCTIEVEFTPSLTGTRSGAITLTSDATTSPDEVSLTGVGVFSGTQLLSNQSFESNISSADWEQNGTVVYDIFTNTFQFLSQRLCGIDAIVPDGSCAFLFQGTGSVEFVMQTVTGLSGLSGDDLTLSFVAGSRGIPSGAPSGSRIEWINNSTGQRGAKLCLTSLSENNAATQITCQVSATFDYDEIRVSIGYRASRGQFGVDQAQLFQDR